MLFLILLFSLFCFLNTLSFCYFLIALSLCYFLIILSLCYFLTALSLCHFPISLSLHYFPIALSLRYFPIALSLCVTFPLLCLSATFLPFFLQVQVELVHVPADQVAAPFWHLQVWWAGHHHRRVQVKAGGQVRGQNLELIVGLPWVTQNRGSQLATVNCCLQYRAPANVKLLCMESARQRQTVTIRVTARGSNEGIWLCSFAVTLQTAVLYLFSFLSSVVIMSHQVTLYQMT